MIRIKLANWYGEHAPGQEVNVSEALLKSLQRDGLVAEVLDPQADDALELPAAEAENGAPEPEAAEPTAELRRKRR
ncbi:hypothetical protein QD712_25850 [Streptomyces acidiscabies]|uniref:hypothetical protein n=1 Tax=Streptomyces acidiscabies TaxID=42234 RepID=UPI0030D3278B